MSSMTRLAEARPEVAGRPHTVVSPSERAALLRSITGAEGGVSTYVGEGDAVDLRPAGSRTRRPLLLAAAVVLVVAAIGLGLALRTDPGEAPAPPATAPPTTVPSTGEANVLPSGFDPNTASAVFSAPGDVNAVLDAYIADRFDAAALPVVRVTDHVGGLATAVWTFGNDTEGTIASGLVLLRRDAGIWVVTASTIEGVDLSTVAYDGSRVTGTVDGPDVRGQLSASITDDPFQFVSRDRVHQRIVLDVPSTEPVLFHVQVTGGATLGVSEVALEPPAVVTEGAGGSSVRVERRLTETCVGLASGAGRVCTSPSDQLWPDGVWYLQLGPTGRHDYQVLVTGFVHPDVASIQVRRPDGTELDVSTSRTAVADGAYVVAAVPLVDGPASVDLLDGSGQVLDTVELAGLVPVGG